MLNQKRVACWGHPGMFVLYMSRPMSSNTYERHALTACSGIVQAGWKTFKTWFRMDLDLNK